MRQYESYLKSVNASCAWCDCSIALGAMAENLSSKINSPKITKSSKKQ